MKTVNSKIIILVLLCSLVGIAILRSVNQPKNSQGPSPSPILTPSSPPETIALNVPEIDNGAPSTAFTFDAKLINVPSRLPTYKTHVRKLPLAKITSALGFSTPPNQNQDRVEIFEKGVGTIKINQNSGHVFFESAKEVSTSTTPPTREEIETISLGILEKLELSTPSLQATLKDYSYHMTNGYNLSPGNTSRANFAIASLALTLNNLPLYLDAPTLQSAKISIDSAKNIQNLSVFAPPNLTESGSKSILNDEAARANLSLGQGSLIQASPKVYYELTVDPTFSRATITEVALVYTQVKDEIIPVFEMRGRAFDDETNREYAVVYLVGAVKE